MGYLFNTDNNNNNNNTSSQNRPNRHLRNYLPKHFRATHGNRERVGAQGRGNSERTYGTITTGPITTAISKPSSGEER